MVCCTNTLGEALQLCCSCDIVSKASFLHKSQLTGLQLKVLTFTFGLFQQVLIPISLYVSIEIVKLGQIYFIHNDLDLYNDQLDSRIQCRALNITEDLGQIQYLFSDKTGTLTDNKMVFRRCSIYGVEYPHEENGEKLTFIFITLSKLLFIYFQIVYYYSYLIIFNIKTLGNWSP